MLLRLVKRWLRRGEEAAIRYGEDALYLVRSEGVQEIPGAPPGAGEAPIPHPATFLALYTGGAARVYRPGDEALKQSRENARYMRADATVMECVELRQRATALLDWRIECDSEEPPYQHAADLVRKILRRIPRFMQYRETLLQAVWYGRYAVENVFSWDWIDGQKLVAVAGWSPIHGDKLVWRIDAQTGRWDQEFGVRIGMLPHSSERLRQWCEANRRWIHSTDFGMAYFPPPGKRELVVIHRHLIEDGEYEEPQSADRVFGVGVRSRIYWVWYQKQQALAWLMEFLERSAFGIELWYYPAGNREARKEMLRAAQNRVGTGKNILLVPRQPGPEGANYGVERLEPSMAGAAALKEIITDYFGHQIKRYILGQTLTTEAHATGLGSNLASIHLDTFMQIVRYDAQNLQETLTDQLVRRLVRWNWPGLDAQLFRLVIEVDKPDVKDRLEALKQAFEMGLRIRSADLRELLSLEQPGPEEESLQHPSYGSPPAPGLAGGPGPASTQPPASPDLGTAEGGGLRAEGRGLKAEGGGPFGPFDQVFQEAAARELYSLPPGLPKNPRPGQIAVVEGKSYRFNENHRWELVQSPQPADPSLFVSPSIEEQGLNPEEAIRRWKSKEHLLAREKYQQIVHQELGLAPEKYVMLDALGDWSDGAENSVYVEFAQADPETLKRMAARMGLVSEEIYGPGKAQKYVAFFSAQPNGPDAKWSAVLHGSLEEVRITLDQVGLKYRTLIPQKEGGLAIICGKRIEILPNIKKLKASIKTSEENYICGIFESIGDDDREKAAEVYRQILFSQKEHYMADQKEYIPFCVTMKDKWFLEEKPEWDAKTKWIAAHMRKTYEWYRMSPEEKAKYLEEAKKGEEELRALGVRVMDSEESQEGAVFS